MSAGGVHCEVWQGALNLQGRLYHLLVLEANLWLSLQDPPKRHHIAKVEWHQEDVGLFRIRHNRAAADDALVNGYIGSVLPDRPAEAGRSIRCERVKEAISIKARAIRMREEMMQRCCCFGINAAAAGAAAGTTTNAVTIATTAVRTAAARRICEHRVVIVAVAAAAVAALMIAREAHEAASTQLLPEVWQVRFVHEDPHLATRVPRQLRRRREGGQHRWRRRRRRPRRAAEERLHRVEL